jgi:tRNA G18 (ribose-2'-O)-methylase SpoU
MTIAPDLSGWTREEIRDTLNEVRFPVEVAVWHTDNYYNFGAIVRNCHNFLVRSIHAIDVASDSGLMYEKATMGTHKYENIYRHSTQEFLNYIGDRPLIAFERRHGLVNEDLRYYSYPANSVLLFGSERGGVPDVLLNRADSVVSIPQFGIHNDMNLSVAVGIVLYDWVNKNVNLR